jgi:hypothetical protein
MGFSSLGRRGRRPRAGKVSCGIFAGVYCAIHTVHLAYRAVDLRLLKLHTRERPDCFAWIFSGSQTVRRCEVLELQSTVIVYKGLQRDDERSFSNLPEIQQ